MIEIPRYLGFKLFGASYVAIMFGKICIVPIIRKATGWEDTESYEWNDKNVQEFIKRQEGKKIVELEEGENYF